MTFMHDRLCVKSMMESPPHDLIHEVVDKHGLETIFRLMTKPRIHKPPTGNFRVAPNLQSSNSNATMPSPDGSKQVADHCRLPQSGVEGAGASVPTPQAISMASKEIHLSNSAHSDKLSTASKPTVFALTEMQERRIRRDMVLRVSHTEIAKLLENMQPIVVKRLPIIKRRIPVESTFKSENDVGDTRELQSSNTNATVAGEEEREASPSPTLSSTTTTSHSSITPDVPPMSMDASVASPPPLLTASAHHYTCAHASSSNAGGGKHSETHELAAAAAAVEALLSLSRVIPSSPMPNNKRPRALWEEVEVGVQGQEAEATDTDNDECGGGGGNDENARAPVSVQQASARQEPLPNILTPRPSVPSPAMPLDSNTNATDENSEQGACLGRDVSAALASLFQLVPARHKRSSPSSRRDHRGSVESRAGAPRPTSKVSRHNDMRAGISGESCVRENVGTPSYSGDSSNAGASPACVDAGASLAWSSHTAAAELLLCAAATAAVKSQTAAGGAAADVSARGSYKCSRCGQPKKGHRCKLPSNDFEGTTHELDAVPSSSHSRAQAVVEREYTGASVKNEAASSGGKGMHGTTSGDGASAADGVLESVACASHSGKHSKEAREASKKGVEQDSYEHDNETPPHALTTSNKTSRNGPSRQPSDKKNQNASGIQSGGTRSWGKIREHGAGGEVKQEDDGHGEFLEAPPATAAATSFEDASPVMARICVSTRGHTPPDTATPPLSVVPSSLDHGHLVGGHGGRGQNGMWTFVSHMSEQTNKHKRRKKNCPQHRSTGSNSPPVQDSELGGTPPAKAPTARADMPTLTSPRTAATAAPTSLAVSAQAVSGPLSPRNRGEMGGGQGGRTVSSQMALFLAGCHTSSSSLRAKREEGVKVRDLGLVGLEGCGGA